MAAALTLANAAYGYFVLPESLPRRAAHGVQLGARQSGRLAAAAGQHRELLGLAGVAFLYHLAHVVLPAVAVLYTSYRYGWDSKTMGLTLAAVGVASGIVQAGLIQPAIRALGERATLLVGLLCGAAGFAIYGLATTGTGFWAGIPVMALWGLGGAAAMGIMSRLVSGSEQGQLQGANSSLMALAGLFGPVSVQLRLRAFHRRRTRPGICPAPRSCWRRRCCSRPRCWRGGSHEACERVTGDIGLLPLRPL